jgi:hypothetical protein
MKKFAIGFSLFALVLFLITGCTFWTKDKPPTDPKTTKTTPKEEQKTPLQVLKETQKKISAISGYRFSRITIQKNYTSTYNNTETGEEQLNPQVAHFTNSKNHEYYYDKQNIYLKTDGQWVKTANKDGKVLVSVLFTNNVEFILKNLGTNEQIPGITVQKKEFEYDITIDYLIFKDPSMADADFINYKKQTKTRKTTLTVDANTFEPKKYSLKYESLDGNKIQSVDLDLAPNSEPLTIPTDIISNAKPYTPPPAGSTTNTNTTY